MAVFKSLRVGGGRMCVCACVGEIDLFGRKE